MDFAEDWPELDFSELIGKEFGIDPLSCSEEEAVKAAIPGGLTSGDQVPNKMRAIDHLWKKIRKTISGPAFLTGVPVYLEPLAKRSAENPAVVERIQVIIAGSEVGKGYSELNDPQDEQETFEKL